MGQMIGAPTTDPGTVRGGAASSEGATSTDRRGCVLAASPRTADGRFARTGPITERELEVLRLATDGHTYMEIGRLLSPRIAETTVKEHVKSLRAKLGARTMVQAVDVAYRRGILEVGA